MGKKHTQDWTVHAFVTDIRINKSQTKKKIEVFSDI